MEETGVLVKLAFIGLVLPDFEPGLKTRHFVPRFSTSGEGLKKPQVLAESRLAIVVARLAQRGSQAQNCHSFV